MMHLSHYCASSTRLGAQKSLRLIRNHKPAGRILEIGPGAGTFLVDGDILEAPFRKQGVETSLGRFRVEPGAERTVDLVTLPEASSCYPAYVTMRPVR